MVSVGNNVINSNDLMLRNINGVMMAISTTVYRVLSTEEDGGGYISVLDLSSNKEVRLRSDLLVKVCG